MEFFRSSWDNAKDFAKTNPLLVPLSLLGSSYLLPGIWGLFKIIRNILAKTDLNTLKSKYKGDWAFVADASKPQGETYALSLAQSGYNLLTLKVPGSAPTPLSAQILALGRQFEEVQVSPFCSDFAPADLDRLASALANKSFGVVVMNLFSSQPSHFVSEVPMALEGSVNVCVIKTTVILQLFVDHLKTQSRKSVVMTVGSIVSAGWPCHQVTSGCAAYIEKLTETMAKEKKSKVKFLHVKHGCVPPTIKNSYYYVDEKVEAEQGLRKIGVCQKTTAHYRTMMQDWFQNSSLGKQNRFIYCKLATMHHYPHQLSYKVSSTHHYKFAHL